MNKEPWLLDYTPWNTRADFYNYIRGGLRKAVWSRHPVKIEYAKSKRFKAPIGVGGKEVWAYDCEVCGKTFRQNQIEVDHLEPAGSLRCEEDLHGFITRLVFVDFDDLRIVDKECHRAISYAERQGITFEESVAQKKAIKIQAEKRDKVFLEEKGITPASNAKGRRQQLVEVLLNETI